MLNKLLLMFITTLLFAENKWFITNLEYGKMLYNNPRGISCAKCHGEKGEGKTISYYIKNNKKIYIKAPNIKHITLQKLKTALFHKSKQFKISIMPIYDYLTDNEIKAILLYLRSQK